MSNKSFCTLVLTFLIAATCQLSTAHAAERKVVNKTIAEIEGEAVTTKDLQKFLKENSQFGISSTDNLSKEELKQALEFYITQTLIEKEAAKIGVNISDADLKRYEDEVKKQNNLDENTFELALKSKGLNITQYRKQIKLEILRTRVTSNIVRNQLNVTEAEIDKFLGKNSNLSKEDKDSKDSSEASESERETEELAYAEDSLNFKQIFIPASNDPQNKVARKAALATIKKMYQVLDEYEEADWKKIGKDYYSEVRNVKKEDLVEDIKEVLEGLSEGEVSEIIKAKNGYYLVSVFHTPTDGNSESVKKDPINGDSPDSSKQDSNKGELTNALDNTTSSASKTDQDPERAKAKQIIFENKFKEKMEKYLRDELPKKYQVEIFLK